MKFKMICITCGNIFETDNIYDECPKCQNFFTIELDKADKKILEHVETNQ